MAIIDASVPRSFAEILGGLMGAVIDAQAQAARATIDFIEDVGTMEGSVDSDVIHELRNISFNYIKKDEQGLPSKFTLELPLLSLVEIPAINIKTATFSFYYDVTNTEDTQTEEEVTDKAPTGDGNGIELRAARKWSGTKKPVKIVGRVSKDTNTTSHIEKNAGIKVDIEFEKSSLPVGLDRILDMLELSANEKPVDKP
ncbi:MAG: DUF2589 domain-containing protein [Desulfobacteraceae bacterium]|nr:DUF2589 domain-containing protein [Desulfobacteraceae bacterium]